MLSRTLVSGAASALAVAIACTGRTSGPGGAEADAAASGDRADARPGDVPPVDARGGEPGEPDARLDAGGNVRAPTFFDDFAAPSGAWWSRAADGASAEIGASAPGAADGRAARLVFDGRSGLGPGDRASPAFASEVGTSQYFGPGELRTRVRLGQCASNEDLVNGIFTYRNDGHDHDGSGLVDNAEIDIEILCGAPTWILMTSWVDYDTRNGERFKRWSRAIDLATGQIMESPADDRFGLEPIGSEPAFRKPGFPRPDAFYEMGFAWNADRVRWFIVIDGVELELWTLRDRQYIPTAEVQILLNLWHPPTHWFAPGGPADHPVDDAAMEIDWIKYWAD